MTNLFLDVFGDMAKLSPEAEKLFMNAIVPCSYWYAWPFHILRRKGSSSSVCVVPMVVVHIPNSLESSD